MRTFTIEQRRRQRGMSVMEALVAILIFSVVFVAALGLYSAANKAYVQTDAATIQQQNVRFAIDRMTDTLRNAGATYNMTGSKTIPDEQVEGIWQSAIFVRGDFDNSRESGYEDSTKQSVVTIGNDELVGYVLRKPGGDTANTVSIDVIMDVSKPRDGSLSGATPSNEETKTIKVAASDLAGQTNPPYQLAKVTFSESGTPQYEVIADNIFRLSFDYFDSTGAAVATYGGADANRATRASLRNLNINLIGMTDRPDLGYTDTKTYTPADTVATNRRKFELSERVQAFNLGLVGKKHDKVPAITIAPPPTVTVCRGHARWFRVTWGASPTAGVTYKLRVTAAAGSTGGAVDITYPVSGTLWDYKQPDGEARDFSFSVAATAASMAIDSSWTAPVVLQYANPAESTPATPSGLTAAGASSGYRMALSWSPVSTNSGDLATSTTPAANTLCKTSAGAQSAPSGAWNTYAIDLETYRVLRVLKPTSSSPIDGSSPMTQIDTQSIGSLTNSTPGTGASFTDNTAAPCSMYFYRVQAADHGTPVRVSSESAAMTSPASISLPSGVVPDVPTSLTGTTSYGPSNYQVTLNWSPVVQTAAPAAPAATAHYRVERYQKIGSGGTWGSSPDATFNNIYETTTFTDNTAPRQVGGVDAFYRYYVSAVYDCSSERVSAQAGPYETALCLPTSAIVVTTPAAAATYNHPGDTQFTPTLSVPAPPSGSWTAATVKITDSAGTEVYSKSITGAPAADVYTFPPFNHSGLDDGEYTLTANGTVAGCAATPVTQTFYIDTPVCTPAAAITAVTVPGSTVTRPTSNSITPTVTVGTPTSGSWTNLTYEIFNSSGTSVQGPVTITGGPTSNTYTFPSWNNSALPDGTYTMNVNGTVNGCAATQFTKTFTLATVPCGLEISTPSWSATTGSSAYQILRFNVRNTCGSSRTITGLKLTWSTGGTLNTRYVTTIAWGATTVKSGITNTTNGGNGVTIPFTDTTTAVISANSTSTTQMIVTFDDNMTTTGVHNSGTPATFSSIQATVSSAQDELIVSGTVP